MTQPHIGRRFGAPPRRKSPTRALRTLFRGGLLIVVMSPLVLMGYQVLVWLRTGNWAWLLGVSLLPADLVSAMEEPASWSGFLELTLYLANFPLVGVLSVLAIGMYVLTDVFFR